MYNQNSTTPDLNEIAEKSLRGWIPAQTKVVEKISRKIRSGAYGNSAQLIIEDLKQDISTYLFIIKAFLDKSILQEDQSAEGEKVPFNMLLTLLEKIKNSNGNERLNNGSEYQLELLKESILASTTVEALSTSFALDKGFAYSISSLRSLGKLLLAWNFPHEFHTAIEILNKSPGNTSLETLLTNYIGFSPAQVGAKVAQKMGIKSSIYTLLQNSTVIVQTSSSSTSVHNRLHYVCDFGEQFAMAHSTLPYNISEKSLGEIVKIIESSLGASGITDIYRKANSALTYYNDSNSKVFCRFHEDGEGSKVDLAQFSLKTEVTRLARKADVKNMDLVSEIISDYGNPANKPLAIKKLVGDLLPGEGLDSIVLYTVDPVEKDLIPICRKGNPSFIKIKETNPIFGAMTNSLVEDVFDSKSAHHVEGFNSEKEEVFAYLAPYPTKKPYGVLYVEAKKANFTIQRLSALSDIAIAILSKLYGK